MLNVLFLCAITLGSFVITLPALIWWFGVGRTLFFGGVDQRQQMALALDRLLNAAAGGSSTETVSGRIGRRVLSDPESTKYFLMEALVNVIFVLVKGEFDHCHKQFMKEASRG